MGLRNSLAFNFSGRAAAAAEGLVVLEQIEAVLHGAHSTFNDDPMAVNPCFATADMLMKLGLPALSQSAASLAEKLPLTGQVLRNQVRSCSISVNPG
jgi:hypothetical protein